MCTQREGDTGQDTASRMVTENPLAVPGGLLWAAKQRSEKKTLNKNDAKSSLILLYLHPQRLLC